VIADLDEFVRAEGIGWPADGDSQRLLLSAEAGL
jgi:hypothetical protein